MKPNLLPVRASRMARLLIPPRNVLLPGNLGTAVLGVAPPARYATPAGRLEVTITGGARRGTSR